MSLANITKRRRADRDKVLMSMPGFSSEVCRQLECWEADLGDFKASVISAYENIGGPDQVPDWRWHVSVAGVERLATWAEFAHVVHEIRPGIVFCMALPPRSWWLNIHEFCLHAWEINDAALVDSWMLERKGHAPT